MALMLHKDAEGKLHLDGEFPEEHNVGATLMKRGVQEGFIKLSMSFEFENGSATYELYDFEAPDTFMFRKTAEEE